MAVVKRLGRDGGDALHRTGHVLTDGMMRVQDLHQPVIAHGAGAVLVHADLLSDNALLLAYALLGIVRGGYVVQQRVEVNIKIIRTGEVIGGHSAAGVGVGRGAAGGELGENIAAVGHVEHFVLQKMGDARRRVDPAVPKPETAVRPAVARGEDGVSAPEPGLGRNKDLQTVGQCMADKSLSQSGIIQCFHQASSPLRKNTASASTPRAISATLSAVTSSARAAISSGEASVPRMTCRR